MINEHTAAGKNTAAGQTIINFDQTTLAAADADEREWINIHTVLDKDSCSRQFYNGGCE